MVRKFLNRTQKESEKSQKASAEDDWAHITDTRGKETNIEIKDVQDVQDRKLTFGDEREKTASWEAVKKETRAARETAATTAKYVKHVHDHLDDTAAQIAKIKGLQEKFDSDIANLQVKPPGNTTKNQVERNRSVTCHEETTMIVRNELVPLLERYGIEQMVAAMEQFLASIKQTN